MLNKDETTNDRIKVVFLPNYRVSLGEKIFPASELSEQISTAGFEASGTGNMKFALNGALTIGTLDGANIEIKEEVGDENIFIFGLTAQQVVELRPNYRPMDCYLNNELLKQTIDLIKSGFFNPENPDLMAPLVDNLLYKDYFMALADFTDYARCQQEVDQAYRDKTSWTKKSIINVAHMGRFSSDRSINDYNREIWHATPVTVTREKEALFIASLK